MYLSPFLLSLGTVVVSLLLLGAVDITDVATPVLLLVVTTGVVGRTELELLEDMRDLGINIDSKLKFHTHTDIVTNEANHILGLF